VESAACAATAVSNKTAHNKETIRFMKASRGRESRTTLIMLPKPAIAQVQFERDR